MGKVVKATGRYALYGSTRYTSKGTHTKRKAPRAKAAAIVGVTSMAGSGIGQRMTKNKSIGTQYAGSLGGGAVGAMVGRRISENRGYIKRTKHRVTVRKVQGIANARNAKTGIRSGSRR